MKRIVHIALFVWCTATPVFSWAGFDEGLDAYKKGDYATALKEWQPLAEQGNAGAQNSLGVAYEQGYGVAQSDAMAVKWYTKAASQDHEAAQFNLGRMYAKGRGVAKNVAKAVKWYTKAAEQGNAAAQNNLGLAYATGQGVKKSNIKAVKWYTEAAEQGHAGAQFSLGTMYARGHGVAKSNVEAVKWYTQAAEQGHVDAQRTMGWMYTYGLGVEKNDAEAAKWYAKAAKQGDADAQRWLNSQSMEQNSREAANNQPNQLEQLAGKVSELPAASRVAGQLKESGTTQSPKRIKIFHDCKGCPEMVVIPAGSFDMGSPDSEAKRDDNEGPVHRVNVASFALGKTEITRGQFAAFIKKAKYKIGDKCWTLNDGKFAERDGNWSKLGYTQDDQHPAACINWNDAVAYAKWMSRKTGKHYRLPTAAEWEYAARGGTSTARYWGDNPDEACDYANVADKTAQAQINGATSWSIHNCTDGFAYTAPVGSYRANAYGLYDMLGNVWEWTEDSYHDSYEGAPIDGSAWQLSGAKRVLRGGSWNNSPQDVRAAIRNMNKPEMRFSIFGFRLARTIP